MFEWLHRFGIVTHRMVGRSHARRNYPRQEHAVLVPTYREARLREAAGEPLDRVGRIVPSGEQPCAPYVANLIAQSEQKQQAIAARVVPQLAALRTAINAPDRKRCRLEARRAKAEALRDAREQPKHGPDMSARTFWIAAIIFFAVEIPVNIGALAPLRMVWFAEPAVAGFIALTNFAAAKVTARVLRQQVWRDGHHAGWALAIILNLALVAMLVSLSVLRADFVAANAGRGANVMITGAIVADAGAQARHSIEPNAVSYAFFALVQFAGYLGILLAGYFQVDPDVTREQLAKEISSLDGAIDAEWQTRGGASAHHNRLLAAGLLAVEEIRDDCRERAYQYVEGNLLWRTDDIPDYFRLAITDDVFKPLFLGRMVEAHPTMATVELQGAEDHSGAHTINSQQGDQR